MAAGPAPPPRARSRVCAEPAGRALGARRRRPTEAGRVAAARPANLSGSGGGGAPRLRGSSPAAAVAAAAPERTEDQAARRQHGAAPACGRAGGEYAGADRAAFGGVRGWDVHSPPGVGGRFPGGALGWGGRWVGRSRSDPGGLGEPEVWAVSATRQTRGQFR